MGFFETHIHTAPCSGCGKGLVSEYVERAAELGLAGLVFTNHFYHGNTGIDRTLPWADFVQPYIDNYLEAKKYGDKKGIVVLFGLEEGFGSGKEMLWYGMSPEAIQDQPLLREMSPREMSDYIHACGGLVSCAHPFRDRDYIPKPILPPDPTLFDAIEVFNACNMPPANELARPFCEENGLIAMSGSDCHTAARIGEAGIDFNVEVTDSAEFVQAVKEKRFSLVTCREFRLG